MSETGMASVGMRVERQSPRKRKVTATTRTKVMNRVWTTSRTEARTACVVS